MWRTFLTAGHLRATWYSLDQTRLNWTCPDQTDPSQTGLNQTCPGQPRVDWTEQVLSRLGQTRTVWTGLDESADPLNSTEITSPWALSHRWTLLQCLRNTNESYIHSVKYWLVCSVWTSVGSTSQKKSSLSHQMFQYPHKTQMLNLLIGKVRETWRVQVPWWHTYW